VESDREIILYQCNEEDQTVSPMERSNPFRKEFCTKGWAKNDRLYELGPNEWFRLDSG
jgi:hypothetical protein